jgi:transposase
MRKIREVLRLALQAEPTKLSSNAVARSTGVSRGSVQEYCNRAEINQLTWEAVQEMDDTTLETLLYPKPKPHLTRQSDLDFEYIHKELKRPGVNLRLLWFEYRANNPDGYSYQQYTKLHREWADKLNLVMRQQHRAGEKLFVDYAGHTVPVIDRTTGEVTKAQIFLATMGASNYTYADAAPSQELRNWISSNVRALEYLGSVPVFVIPDNLKSAITQACRCDPVTNKTFRRMAEHYGFTIMPARPRKPRDKAKVEKSVQVAETWILGRLRNRDFFTFEELNAAIKKLLEELNHKAFQKLSGNRLSWFETIDKPAMKPLPAQRFEFEHWSSQKVSNDYHLRIDGHYYSVDHKLVKQRLDIRTTDTSVEMFHKGNRVASHCRNNTEGGQSTNENHMPPAHKAYAGRTPEQFISEAKAIGPATAQVIQTLLAAKPLPQLSFDLCFGILKSLKKKYSASEVEEACLYALRIGTPNYRAIKGLLAFGIKNLPAQLTLSASSSFHHENIRGSDYFNQEENSIC